MAALLQKKSVADAFLFVNLSCSSESICNNVHYLVFD